MNSPLRLAMTWRLVLLAATLLIVGAFESNVVAQESTYIEKSRDSLDHSRWDALLRRFVDGNGDVAYERLQEVADSALTPYLHQLAAARPTTMSRDRRLALWINAYNAYTLELILDHYPVQSIQNIGGPSSDKTPFQRPVGEVADTMRTLDEIEHEIIRQRFDEPRIHFVLVCAAKSCPRLRQEAYTGRILDRQLDDQTRRFLHDERKNHIPAGKRTIELSPIFKWYGQDFGPDTDAIQRFIAGYFDGAVRDSLQNAAYDVQFLEYDWTLNDQALTWHEAGAPSDDS